MIRLVFAACLLSIFSCALLPSAAADSLIHFTCKPGNAYGQPEDITVSAANGYHIELQRGFEGSIQIDAFPADVEQPAYVSGFAAPYGSLPAVGSYPNTAQQADDTTPGLYFAGGEPDLTSEGPGNFRVLEVSYDADGNVLAFAADFVQRNPATKSVTRGQVRYNSAIPVTTPGGTAELANATERVSEKAGSLTVTVNRNGGSVGALAVQYATADGTDLAGRDYTAVSGTLSWTDGDATDRTITIPILDSGNPAQGDGTFFVNLSGAGVGLQAQDAVTVVNDNSAITFVHVLYPPDPATGKATERTFSLDTGYVIRASQSVGQVGVNAYAGTVSFSFDNQAAVGSANSDSWALAFSTPQDQSLGVGDYEDARQYPVNPFFDPGHPGLVFYGNGGSTDSLTGNFQVLEAQYDAAGNVLRFSANFEEYGDGSAQPIRGEVRYNSTLALPTAVPQVTALAVTPLVFDDGRSLVQGVFKIVRTGDTTKPLDVTCRLGGTDASGRSLPPFVLTKTIPAGKSSAHVKVEIPTPGTGTFTVTVKLKVKTPSDGSYAVPNGKAVKIVVYY